MTMFGEFSNAFGPKPSKGGPLFPESFPGSPLRRRDPAERPQTFSKVFRWRLPDGHRQAPASVEIVGSFTHWQKVALLRDSELDAWHVTLHHIPGHRTHHYMLLVDGKPVHDRNADGMAVPHGPQEEQYQLQTDRGGRVFMLYAQTK
jgi:Glycogen recognition site of AMP-activated protein kinase